MQATPTSHPKDVVSHTKLHRGSAEAARGAHNPEVTGSTPVPGIYHFVGFKETDGHSSSDHKHEQHSPGWRRGSARGS